ncbi:beta-galactosidase [Vallitalea longa]|uniref:Beta-galactosidase n=1 Tax=Vallitalea longa TaxID=2936439 RepID=A0A9W6DFQ0_9FIRM|nr:glycoside hydrolase family 2 TIM barrel-domain containing protein [Vallitalea longa]GKX31471.1 beta-galactosidase [Vallitalea longa]
MKKINFNDNWEYTNIDVETNKDLVQSMTVFKPVELPHDYTIENVFDKSNLSSHQGGYVRTGTLWYRKYMKLEKVPDNQTFLLFEGVYSNSTIYVNGEKVYSREYGYSSLCVNISDYLKQGVNLIAVYLDGSKEPSTRWFNGQGITRNVWIMSGDNIYIKNDGVFIKPKYVEDGKSVIPVLTTVVSLQEEKNVSLEIDIQDIDGNLVERFETKVDLNIGENNFNNILDIKDTKLWSCNSPYLYKCIVSVETDNQSHKDSVEINFGVRSLEFKPNQGFFLNGIHTYFKGVCLHHDGGCVGAAVPKSLWKKRILMLKEMGCNSIRTSHNPFNPEFYDLCDELGMMVVDEAFDGWEIPKVKYGYGTIWDKCHVQDLSDLIIRDRNHPSVVMWSIGNEVLQMSTEITKELMAIIRNLDDTRKITAGVQQTSKASDDNRALLDVAGYNDGGGACFIYEQDHEKRPDQLFVATEAPHSFQTRGFYRTKTWWRDKNQPRMEIENLTEEEIFFDQNFHYNSSYDNAGVRTCARDSWALVEKLPYLCGEFRWTGFDYVGEAFPHAWPSKSHNFGVIDTANFPKDHFYLYQSMWKEEKILHILPHWTHRYLEKSTKVPVWVYTNLEEVELFLNDNSLGKKTKGTLKNLEWLVPYEEGTILAKGYENGNLVIEEKFNTAYTPNNIQLTAEILPEDTKINVAQLTFEVKDKSGNFVSYANNITGLYLSPNIKLLGSDNGAIDDMSPFKSMHRRAFNGLGMYLIKFNEDEVNFATVVSILGDNYFDEVTSISIDVKSVYLTGNVKNEYEIFYTTDCTIPNRKSNKYTSQFSINETTEVKIAVYKDNVEIMTLSDIFIKGRPEPVVDLIHLNHEVEMEIPAGPFSDKIIGEWENVGSKYIFHKDGKVVRKLGIIDTCIGYWWYDFPTDFLETPDYAGIGEIWLSSGNKVNIKLEDQKAKKLIIDNSQNAMGNIVVNIKEIVLTR